MARFNLNRANGGPQTAMKRLARLALMLTVSTVTLLAPVAHADSKGDLLIPGQHLAAGDWLQSPNRAFRLVMQTDGNLVLYRTRDGAPLWASGTAGRAVSSAIMQVGRRHCELTPHLSSSLPRDARFGAVGISRTLTVSPSSSPSALRTTSFSGRT